MGKGAVKGCNTSPDDRQFRSAVETGAFPVDQFDHRAHLRLAYIYLAETECVASTVELVKTALTGLLAQAGIPPSEKYHATLTEAWLNLVAARMHSDKTTYQDVADFLRRHAELLDTKLLLTYYSESRLYSEVARNTFQEPDLNAFSSHQ